jgi:hypothetical protein
VNCVICDHSASVVFLDWLEQMETEDRPTETTLNDPAWGGAPAFCRTHVQALTSSSAAWVSKNTKPITNK